MLILSYKVHCRKMDSVFYNAFAEFSNPESMLWDPPRQKNELTMPDNTQIN